MSTEEDAQMQFSLPWGPKEVNAFIGRLAELESTLDMLQSGMDEATRAARKPFEEKIDEAATLRDQIVDHLATYFREHREELTADGKKTLEYRNGVVKWRKSKPKLEFEEGVTEEGIIERIKRLGGLRRFTRRGPRKLDKDALKKDPGFVARVKGLFIGQHEDLIIKPNKLEREIVKAGDPYKVVGETVKKD